MSDKKKFSQYIKKTKRRIMIYKKYLLFYGIQSLAIGIEMAVLMLLLSKNHITKEMLYWLCASISQSMAAIFALVGMFAIFRFERLSNLLRNHYDILKNRINGEKFYFGIVGTECWEDFAIIGNAEKLLEIHSDLPLNIRNNIINDITYIRGIEYSRSKIISISRMPLMVALITILCAILFILLIDIAANRNIGKIFSIVIVALTTITLVNIFYYLVKSIPVRHR